MQLKTNVTKLFRLEGLVLLCLMPLASIAQTYSPIALTGFNADVVADGAGTVLSSTTNDVDGVNYNFVALGYVNPSNQSPTSGLPASGTINSAMTPGLNFQLEPYNSNNSLRISGLGSGTLNFVTPMYTDNLYVLATSGSGSTAANITVTFMDQTTQSFTQSIADWYNATGFAIQGISRVNRTNNTIENSSTNPRIYQLSLPISPGNMYKPIQSITFNKTISGGILNVMGLSLKDVPVQNDVAIMNLSTTFEPCFLQNDTLWVEVLNTQTSSVNFSTLNLEIAWSITGPVSFSGTRTLFSGTLAGNSSMNLPIAIGMNFSTPGIYNISATVTSSWDGIPINNNVTRALDSNPFPVLASTNNTCLGSLVDLSLNGYNGTNIQWQVDTGSGFQNIAGATSLGIQETLTGNSVYRAIYCSHNIISASVTVNAVFVNPPIVQGGSACFGEHVVATASSNLDVTWYDAAWGGNLLGNGNSLQVNNLQANTVIYAQTNDGTAMNCPSVRAPAQLVMEQYPVISLPNDTAYCAGDILELDPGAGPYIYAWSTGAATQSIAVTASGTYGVTAYSSIGCSNSASIAITIFPLPNVLAHATSTSICKGGDVMLYGSGADFFNWDNGITNGISFNPTNSGIYVVTGMDLNLCVNTDTIGVLVHELPGVSHSNLKPVCINHVATELSGGNPPGGIYTSTIGNISGNLFNPSLAGIGNHSITYTYTDSNQCTVSVSLTMDVGPCAGIEKPLIPGTSVQVYPNPANSVFTLEMLAEESGEAWVLISDQTGRLVESGKIMLLIGTNKLTYDLTGQARGLYQIKVISNKGEINKKIIMN